MMRPPLLVVAFSISVTFILVTLWLRQFYHPLHGHTIETIREMVGVDAHQVGEPGEAEPLCPFADAADDEHHHHHDHDHDHHHHEDTGDKINGNNYREWVGEYTNSKGQQVQIPLLFTLPGTRLHLLTQRNFMEFVAGNHVVLPKSSTEGDDLSSSVFRTKEKVVTLTVVFWYKRQCGGLCEDAYAEYKQMVAQWQDGEQSAALNQSLLMDHNIVVQFGQYEVVEHEEHKGDISYKFGPNATQVFDFPTVTITLATPEEQKGQPHHHHHHHDDVAEQVHHVKRIQLPRGFEGPLCTHSLLHKNIVPALNQVAKIIADAKKKEKEKREANKSTETTTGAQKKKEEEEVPLVELSNVLLQYPASDCSRCNATTSATDVEQVNKKSPNMDEGEEETETLPTQCATFEDGVLELL